MLNFLKLDKSELFKFLKHILIVVIILVLLILVAAGIKNYHEIQHEKLEENKQEQLDNLKKYKQKMDSIEIVNQALVRKQEIIENKLDSLLRVQEELFIQYEKEIGTINNATIDEHGEWFITTIDSLKNSILSNQ